MAKNVKGLSKVLRGINSGVRREKDKNMAGLLAFGMVVEGEAKRRTPREYGNLVGSTYVRKSKDAKREQVEIGYTADYALYVHENIEMKWRGKPRKSGLGKYWGPKGEARFLYNALMAKAKDAAKIIKAYRG